MSTNDFTLKVPVRAGMYTQPNLLIFWFVLSRDGDLLIYTTQVDMGKVVRIVELDNESAQSPRINRAMRAKARGERAVLSVW